MLAVHRRSTGLHHDGSLAVSSLIRIGQLNGGTFQNRSPPHDSVIGIVLAPAVVDRFASATTDTVLFRLRSEVRRASFP